MAPACHTCEHRHEAVAAWPSPPSQLDVCIITLKFAQSITQPQLHLETYLALNTLMNDIIDHEESTSHPSTFTVWSPSRSDPTTAVIITTVRGVCNSWQSPIFNHILRLSRERPRVRHMFLDLAVTSLAASSPEDRIACDIIQLCTWRPEVAVTVGRTFGWGLNQSSLSAQMQRHASAAFSRPGDLVRDFFAWAEVPYAAPQSTPSPATSSVPSTPSQSSMTLAEQQLQWALGEETLVMIFQWSNRANAERFKDLYKKSYGSNDEEVEMDLWKSAVMDPIAQLQRLDVTVQMHELELRAVEPRLCNNGEVGSMDLAVRDRRRSKRLSVIVSELGDRVSGWWNKVQ